MIAAKRNQIAFVHLFVSRPALDEGTWCFAPFFIGLGDDGDEHYGLALGTQCFGLGRNLCIQRNVAFFQQIARADQDLPAVHLAGNSAASHGSEFVDGLDIEALFLRGFYDGPAERMFALLLERCGQRDGIGGVETIG